jgi:quercetin dioxygenase-like cupin family protein
MVVMSGAVPVIRQANEGERLAWAGGGVMTLKAAAAETAEALMMLEFSGERGKVTPLHLHPGEDEGFYVIEGEVLVHVDGEEHRIGKGGVFVCPRGVPHAFMITSERARLLSWQTPGSGEAFYREASDPASADVDDSHPPDWERLREVAERSPAIELVGPPPFEVTREEAASARS